MVVNNGFRTSLALAVTFVVSLALVSGCPASKPAGPAGGTKTGGGGDGTTTPETSDALSLATMTTENTPKEWWTLRDDTPWAAETSLDGEKKLDADVTLANGKVIPAGTYMRWRRILPGYDVDPSKMYRESKDEFFKQHMGQPTQHHEFNDPAYKAPANQMIIGSIGAASNLNPVLTQDTASSDIVYFTFSRLIDIDDNWKPIPQLAEGFTVSPDGLQYTYYIRKGTKFSDGSELTAADVVFTYSSINNPDVQSPRKGDFVDLDHIEADDDYTVTFHLKQVSAPFITQPAYGIMPKAQFEVEENRDMNKAYFNLHPVGGGPYLVEDIKGEDVYLTRNPEFYGRKPALDSIIFKKTPDQALEQKQLENHEIDLGSVMIHDLDLVAQNHPEIREFRTAIGLGYSYIGFNLHSTFFQDLKVRQAIAYAVNRQELITQVIKGQGSICNANIPPMSPYYNKDVKGYDYNPEQAKKLLAEAGWTDHNGNGIIDKDGREFSFELITNDGNPYRKQIAELVQQDLKIVGIEAKPTIIEWSSFINDRIHEHRFEAYVLGWSLSVDPDDFTIFHSSQFDDGLNYGYYANPRVDELLEKGRRTVDFEARKAIYFEIQDTLAQDLPYLFLFYTKKSGGALKKLAGLPQVEPADTSYLVPPLAGSDWWAKGFEPKDGGPTLSPTDN
ncbi:MAG: peptide-binding protein [bacterium]